jgi:hypothetical protein
MTEKPSETESKMQKQQLRAELKIPMAASIEDIRRAVKILSDNGGQARMSKIGTSFGTKPSEKNLFSWALNAAVAFGLVMPHSRNAPYVLSEDGTKFTGLNEDQQRVMMLEKFLKFEGYKTILVVMKNNNDKTLKKQIITEMWSQIGTKKVLGTRQMYTLTFASVGVWCGALDESGQSCILKPEAEKIFEQILKGEQVAAPPLAPPINVPAGGGTAMGTITTTTQPLLVSNCPHCGKTEFSIENEELLQTLSTDNSHTLIIKSTYYCKGCSRTFSRIDQRQVKVGD